MGILRHRGGNGDMYCYVLEWDWGLKSQCTGIRTSTGTSLMFLVLHKPSYGSFQGVEIATCSDSITYHMLAWPSLQEGNLRCSYTNRVMAFCKVLKSQNAVIPYPTTCLPIPAFRRRIFNGSTQTESWHFVGC